MIKRKVKHKIEQRICLNCGKLGVEVEIWNDEIECNVHFCDDCYAKIIEEIDEQLGKEELEELGISDVPVVDSKNCLTLVKS